ncbi:MAG: hypothetical protein ABEJ97_05970 [Halobellus sp.]
MLLRATALAFGIAELLAPRRVVDFWMSLATDDDGEPRRWIYAAARIEGVLLVLWALTRGRSGGS